MLLLKGGFKLGLFDSFVISASGLTAERLRLDVIADNIANISTTRSTKGGPYRRRTVIFAQRVRQLQNKEYSARQMEGAGVKVVRIIEDQNPPNVIYDPLHPDANEKGYVSYPNINIVNEMVDMLTATRSYEANATVFEASKGMALKALEIGRG